MEVWGTVEGGEERWEAKGSTWPICAAHVLWVKLCAVQHTYIEDSGLQSLHSHLLQGEVFKFSVYSLLNDMLHLPCSMMNAMKLFKMWGQPGSRQGRGTRSSKYVSATPRAVD